MEDIEVEKYLLAETWRLKDRIELVSRNCHKKMKEMEERHKEEIRRLSEPKTRTTRKN